MAEQRAEVAAITAGPGRRRSTTPSSRWNGPARRCGGSRRCSSCSSGRCPPRASARSRRGWRRCSPRTPTRSPWTRPCSPGWTRCTPPAHELGLDPESLRLLERRHRDAVRAGARLGPAAQERLRALNAELSALSTEFGTRLLADTNAAAVRRRRPRAARRARRPTRSPPPRGRPSSAAIAGRHLLPLVLPTHQPALASLTDRALREQLFRASVSRGARRQRARHPRRRPADHRAACRAGRPARPPAPRLVGDRGRAPPRRSRRSTTMLAALAPPAVRQRRAPRPPSCAAARRAPDRARGTAPSTPSGSAASALAVDAAALRPYLELERVLHDGVFAAAGELYGLQLHRAPRPARPTTPTCGCFDVRRRRRARSACSSPTTTPATPSAAAPG